MGDFLKDFKTYINKDLPPEELRRLKKIESAREDFWEYCKLINPKFFKESKLHLKTLANELQALYEGRIRKFSRFDEWKVCTPEEINELFTDDLQYFICRKFILNLPPRHGKSYTLTLFAQWIVGKNKLNKIITVCYNDTLSGRFSSNVRNGIEATKIDNSIFLFSDVFPDVKIKDGDGAKQI